jgi:hypothetical protein
MKIPSLSITISIVLLNACTSSDKKKTVIQEAPVVQYENSVKSDITAGEVIPAIKCAANSLHTYALYAPLSYSNANEFPILYFFDPHANGTLPLEKYKSLAEEFNIIMAGSNNSKNGMAIEESSSIAKEMMDDCRNKFHVDNTYQILSGFSGGSKVACNQAFHNFSITGLIACSGAIVGQQPFPDDLNIVSIAGSKDFNYHEMLAFDNFVNGKNKHIFIETDETHEWPPVDAIREALTFVFVQKMKKKNTGNTALLDKLFTEAQQKLVRIEKQKDIGLKELAYKNFVTTFDGMKDVVSVKEKRNILEKSTEFGNYVTKKKNIIYQEKEIQKMLNDAFANQNSAWWEKEISDLKIASNKTNDKLLASLNSRLLGYVGIAAYSYATQLVNANEKEAEKVLAIYKTVEPSNSEAYFLSAVFNANNGKKEIALKDFELATAKGFTDRARINKYPALQNLIAP